jgi:hypothetical protein
MIDPRCVLVASLVLLPPGPAVLSVDPPDGASVPDDSVAAAADRVVALLEDVQRCERDLVAFTAKLSYWREDALLGQSELRQGRLVYERAAETGARRIGMLFDVRVTSGRRTERRRDYVFTQNLLVEVDHDNRHFIKREIAPPGQSFDPFRLGEGPFPLPVGQAPDEVLARFDAELIAPPAEGPLAKLDGAAVDGLRLVPKADSRFAKDVSRVDVFYDRATRLPVGVEVVERNGDKKIARLEEPARNAAIAPELLARLDVTTPPPEGWRIDVSPWEDRP